MRDRPNVIFDFEVGIDFIDLTKVLKGKRFQSDTPLDDFVRIRGASNRTVIRIDQDGNGDRQAFKTLAVLKNVDVNAIDVDRFIV